jgi:hypothetical protein
MAGRPKLYTNEQKANAIKKNSLKAYLKKNGKTEEDYNQWREELALRKQIAKLKSDFNEVISNKDHTKISILSAVLRN